MTVSPADNSRRVAASKILTAFLHDYGSGYGSFSELYQEFLYTYGLSEIKYGTIDRNLRHEKDLAWKDNKLFFFLEPVERHNLLPIVTMESFNDWVTFRIYTLFVTRDPQSNLQMLAIRFESDEGDGRSGPNPGAHDFFHAQLCKSILDRVSATTPEWISDSQPSMPLDADNQVDLILCMLISVYGGRYVISKLGTDAELRSHLNRVRALARPK